MSPTSALRPYPLASSALFPYVDHFGSRCFFTGTAYETGAFSIWQWIGENGSTGVNRLKISYRVQVSGENYYGQASWVTIRVFKVAVNFSVPDSWNTWIPASGWVGWYDQSWGDPSFVTQYGPWRLQNRPQWLHRYPRGLLPDRHVVGTSFNTRCQGQPDL